MPISIHVEGGTGAGKRKAPAPPHKPWLCSQCKVEGHRSVTIPGYRAQCDRGHRRNNGAR